MARQSLHVVEKQLPKFCQVLILTAIFLGSTLSVAGNTAPDLEVVQIGTPTISEQLDYRYASPDLKTLMAGKPISGAITSKTISPIHLTIPSLWWISEQLNSLNDFGKNFVHGWIAYPSVNGKAGRVALLVNDQRWDMLDYLQRYEAVRRFSLIARSYGYNTLVYSDPNNAPVALYHCDFTPAEARILEAYPEGYRLEDLAEYARNQILNEVTCKLRIDSTFRTGRRRVSF